jgi:hypothetical protein
MPPKAINIQLMTVTERGRFFMVCEVIVLYSFLRNAVKTKGAATA